MNTNARVKTPPPSFYGLETEEQVARHLKNIDFEYDPAKTAIAVWFGVPYNEVESLPGYEPGAMDGPSGAINGIAFIAAACPKLDNILRYVSGGKHLLAHPDNFCKGLWIVKAGSRKDPCIFIFKDGHEITADGIPTYGKGLRRVSWVWTTMDNDVDGEQLLAWQQERRDNRRAA